MDAMVAAAVGLGGVVLGLGALWLGFRWFEWSNLYHPTRRWTTVPSELGVAYRDVDFMAEDGVRLHGWWVPAEHARGTVMVCHGNAGNISDRTWLAADLHRLGVNVFLFDYRGYGKSRGWPTEQGTYRDARAAYEVVRARHGDAQKPPVVVYGRSLGGVVAVDLAHRRSLRGLIVEGAFSSTPDMARHLFPRMPFDRFCRFRYDARSRAAGLSGMAKLFVHSRLDEVVPFELGWSLYQAATEPKAFHELCGGHNEAGWVADPTYWNVLEAFLDDTLGERLPAATVQ